jgi:hypothetical protein
LDAYSDVPVVAGDDAELDTEEDAETSAPAPRAVTDAVAPPALVDEIADADMDADVEADASLEEDEDGKDLSTASALEPESELTTPLPENWFISTGPPEGAGLPASGPPDALGPPGYAPGAPGIEELAAGAE